MFCPGFASASTTRPFHSAATNAGTQAMQASNAGEQANVRGQEPASRGLHLHACTCTCDARKRSRHSRKQSQHGGNQTPRRLGSRHEVCHEHRQHRGQAPTTGALACSGCSPCAQVGKRARVRGCSWSMLWGSGDGFLELGQSPNLEIKIYIFFRPND